MTKSAKRSRTPRSNLETNRLQSSRCCLNESIEVLTAASGTDFLDERKRPRIAEISARRTGGMVSRGTPANKVNSQSVERLWQIRRVATRRGQVVQSSFFAAAIVLLPNRTSWRKMNFEPPDPA